MEQVISVGKRSSNSSYRRPQEGRKWRKKDLKRHWRVYFLDEDGYLRTKRIHWYEVFWYRRKKVKRV